MTRRETNRSPVRAIASLAAGALLLSGIGCGGASRTAADPVAQFRSALFRGADCASLFEIRNRLGPADPKRDVLNEELRSVGCFSSTSERTR